MIEEWLAQSIPINTEEAALGHIIPDHRKAISFFNLLNNFTVKVTLAATFFFLFLVILAISVLINEISHRIRFEESVVKKASRRASKLSNRIASAVSSFRSTRLSAIAVFALSVNLFIWITQLLLTNNIKVPERPTGLSLKLEDL